MTKDGLIEADLGDRMAGIDFNPTRTMLRQFGVAALLLPPLAAWLIFSRPNLWPLGELSRAGVFVWCMIVLGVAASGLAIVRPVWLRLPFIALAVTTFPIGVVVGEILFAVVYFLVLTPFALVFRLIGRDELRLRTRPGVDSFWIARKQRTELKDYYRQS